MPSPFPDLGPLIPKSLPALLGLGIALGSSCCQRPRSKAQSELLPKALSAKACRDRAESQTVAPRVSKAMLKADYWLQKSSATDSAIDSAIDQALTSGVLMSPPAIQRLNAHSLGLNIGLRDLPTPLDESARIRQGSAHHIEQQEFVRARLGSQEYIESIPGATARADLRVSKLTPRDDYFRLLQATPLRCWPIEGSIYKIPPDPAFDRNNCSTLHPPALVHRITSGPEDRWHYVQGRFAEGWVQNPKWHAVQAKAEDKRNQPEQRWVLRDHKQGELTLRLGATWPANAQGELLWPQPPPGPTLRPAQPQWVSQSPLPLRRDLLFQAAFSLLDRPYGWGGYRGERDCSRYLLDLMALFGLRLPRFSGHQAKVGAPIDVSALDESQKRAAIRRWNRDHIVLLFMRGHIMLYLGSARPSAKATKTHDYAISAISEFVTPCFDPQKESIDEQIHRLDRVTVTDLELGRDTPRKSFIERITTLVVLGPRLEDPKILP